MDSTSSSPVPDSAASGGFHQERWLAAALLVLVVTVFAIFVIVLQAHVRHAELMQMQQHQRAVAEAECGVSRSVQSRRDCVALLDGGQARAVAARVAAPPENNIVDGRLTTASVSTPGDEE